MKLFKNRRKQYQTTERTTFPTVDMCRDPMSDPTQVPFSNPHHLNKCIKECRGNFRKTFQLTDADMVNESMLDVYIDNIGSMDRNKADEEYAHHKSVINQIENAQKMRVEDYTQKVERIDHEVECIKNDYPDIEVTDISYLRKLQRGTIPFYKQTWCLALVVLFSIVLDYMVLNAAIDSLLTQAVALSILLSVCLAALIDVVPAIGGVYLKDEEAENRKPVLIMLGIIFITLFIITFILRFATMDSLYQDSSMLFLGTEEGPVSTGHTSAEIVMTVLLGIEPLLSSLLSLVFGFIGATSEEKKKNMSEVRLSQLYAAREEYQIRIRELEEVIAKKQNLINEEEAYKAQLDLIEVLKAKLKEEARIQLAEICKKPEANGHILQREAVVPFQV